MNQLNQEGPRFTLQSIEQGVTYWISCQLGDGGINKVFVAPDKKVEGIPDKIKIAVDHHFEMLGYKGSIKYNTEPI